MIQQAEKNLKPTLEASESRFRSIVQQSADGVVLLDQQGKIRFLNPAAVALLGKSERKLLGRNFGIPMTPGETAEIDIRRQGKPAGVAEVKLVETSWKGELGYLATLRDVSERKRLQEKAGEAVRRRDAFLATLSHELRNPLSAITSAVDVLSARSADSQDEETIGVLRRQCKQMSRLLDDLLDVSRVSQNKIRLKLEPLDLAQLVDELGKCFRGQFAQRGLTLTTLLSGHPLPVRGDYVRLQQTFANLLNNAAKYTPPGGCVRLTAYRDGTDGVVSIRDNGVGIRPELLDAIFEPFVQDEIDSSLDRGGLGIGLALVSKLVESHQGIVMAKSDGRGTGCEFIVRLPISTNHSKTRDGELPATKVTPLKIAVVEDNRDVRDMLKSLLELDGHEVETAEDGSSGIDLIELNQPDVALVDLTMPKVDGIELARQIRANLANANVQLVALTGHGQPEDIRRTREAGFDAHLVKPVGIRELLGLLAECGKLKLATA